MPNAPSSQTSAAASVSGPTGNGEGATSAKTSGPDPLVGRTVSERFKITALIARGGMGKVYRAEQAPLGRVCALKVLNPSYSGEHDPEFHKRFFLEASISSKLTHPNTVTIFDYGRTDDNIYYMAMEYLEGRTLHRALREEGPFTEERATHIARQICRSLREAHSLGVIHRDLKPANVYLIEHGDETDFVKVLDFGLVKNIDESKGEDLTQTGLFMGSPKYMAPEQIRGEHVDARTDIYALGIIIYEMVTGKVPFDRPNSVNILMAHVNERVPALREMNPAVNVSEAFEAVIFKCVEKNADNRFKTMDEVLAALKRASGAATTGTVSGANLERSGSFELLGSGSGSFTPQPNPLGGSVNVLSPDSSISSSGNVFGNAATAPGTATSAAPAEMRKSKAPLFIGGGVVLAILIAVAAMASGGKQDPAKNAAGTGATAASATAPTKATASGTPSVANAASTNSASSAPAAAAVKLAIDSDPTGAEVRDGDDVLICRTTPCSVEVSERPKTLKLTLKDYADEKISVKKGDEPYKVKLKKNVVWTPPPSNGGKKDDGKPPPGQGSFKDSPY
jgi:serine/threonine protein kinase